MSYSWYENENPAIILIIVRVLYISVNFRKLCTMKKLSIVSYEAELRAVSRSAGSQRLYTYGPIWVEGYFFRTSSLLSISASYSSSSRIRAQIPPGAVGGLYGSGCFHFSNKASASSISAFSSVKFPYISNSYARRLSTYSLSSGLSHSFVYFEERSNVLGLATP